MIATAFMGYNDSPKCIYIAITPFISPVNLLRRFLENVILTRVFEDLDKESTRSEGLSKICYYLYHYIKTNGKLYVGRAVQGQIYIRFYKHMISGKGGSRLVFAADVGFIIFPFLFKKP